MKFIRSKDDVRLNKKPFFSEEDLFSELEKKTGTSLFLGKYSLTEIEAVLRKKNLFKEAKKRKLWPLDYDIDSSSFPPLQRFRIYYGNKNADKLIVDLKLKEAGYRPKAEIAPFFDTSKFKFLNLEWLTLQNPLLEFSDEKSPLPGQEHPGLSLGKKVRDLFVYLARLLKDDGLLAFPAYFHNAILFSRSFKFINPDKEGEILAIIKSFPEVTFKQLAWIVHLNCLLDGAGEVYEWKAEEQIFPLHKELTDYFQSDYYHDKVKEAESRMKFGIDWPAFQKRYPEKAEDRR